MKSLIMKDMMNLRKYFKTIAIFVVLYSFITFSMDDISFISGMITMLFMMIPITSFAYDQNSKWDLFALTLPISRKDIVFCKYLLSIGFIGAGALMSIIIGLAIMLIKNSGIIDIKMQFIIAYTLFAVGIVFISILLPLIYKYGVEKSRIMMFIVFLIPTILILLLSRIGVPMPTETDLLVLLKISPIILLLILILSFLLSYKLFRAKDL